ncbi:hypothetical protein DSO57_1010337 [Entomophthora muscae]|uniref:Uncharacterized protein n=1 Tax=Entomophthora muscae TaxID=34485 RepID=A0ACC2TI22_9FUNG|nr:hypothetical protein DSO57_1010337 [Entomophthora muscae]
MRRILFLSWFLASFLPVVSTLENPTPTTDWYNSSPDDAHQKESLAHGWFKYPSGHWGRRFAYLGHLGHLAMVTVPIGSVIAGLNLGALAHQLGNLFPAKWVPEIPISLRTTVNEIYLLIILNFI